MPATDDNPPSPLWAAVVEIQKALIRIEVSQAAAAREAEHRHNNMKSSIEAMMPRREAEQIITGLNDGLKTLGERIDAEAKRTGERLSKLESFQGWVAKGAATGAATAVGVLGVLAKRWGIPS